MFETNAWNRIPLEDYELHMGHKNVAQSQLLNNLTKKYLQKYQPKSTLFLGISGGNGLEHIDANVTEMVCGIDINSSYLKATQERFGDKIKQLLLVNTNISESKEAFVKADFIWASLIFEYIEIEKGFEFISNNIAENTKLIITIQVNNGSQTVSQTGVETIKYVKDIFILVDKNGLENTALKFGFELINSEENILPNGKALHTYEFEKNT